MIPFPPHHRPDDETHEVLYDPTLRVEISIILNFLFILCNFLTFWLQQSVLPLPAIRVLNNLFSLVGIVVALASLQIGWRYVRELPNRLSFSLFWVMNLLVSMQTMS